MVCTINKHINTDINGCLNKINHLIENIVVISKCKHIYLVHIDSYNGDHRQRTTQ